MLRNIRTRSIDSIVAEVLLIYRRWGIWPAPAFWLTLRMILLAAAWLSLAYLTTTLLATAQQIPDPRMDLAGTFTYVSEAPVLFLYMLAPAGLICPFVGLASGMLLLHAGRRQRRRTMPVTG